MKVRVPVAAPGRIAADEMRAIRAAIDSAVISGSYIGGPSVAAFEEAFAAEYGAQTHCVAVGNGTDALTLALAALELPPGSCVLVPANDGGFAAIAVQGVGLRPVQMDCASDGLVDLAQVKASWGPTVAALVVTHLHGLVVDTGPIRAWCDEQGVRLIEDCAQAHGAHGIAARADVAAFSFYPTKNLGALGDGGAVVTHDPGLARRVRQLRQYGWGARYRVELPAGRNSRMDSVQAAVLAARLPFLRRNNALRRSVIARYARSVPGHVLLGHGSSSFVAHHAVLLAVDRGDLVARLRRSGIGHDIHYPHLVSHMPGVTLVGTANAPTADAMRARILSLPCFPTISQDEVSAVCEVLEEWAGVDRG